MRCSAFKGKDKKKKCTHDGKILVSEKEFLCWVHWKVWYKKQHNVTTPPEPWALLGFNVEPHVNKNDTVLSIRASLRTPPMTKDDGWIYCFRMKNDSTNMYKIGRTTQTTVKKRLDDWPGSILIDSWKTPYVTYVETLIHQFLEKFRVLRYVMYVPKKVREKRYVSTWYSSELPVHDDVWSLKECPDWMADDLFDAIKKDQITPEITFSTPRNDRHDVEIEFFYCKTYTAIIKKTIENVIAHTDMTPEEWFIKFLK